MKHYKSKKRNGSIPYRNSTGHLLALARVNLVIVLANALSIILQHAVNANILCLLLGIVFSQFGLLETNVLQKASAFNWLIYGLTAYIFSQLSTTTPSTLLHFIPQIFTLMILAIVGMWIMTRLIHKFFGYSKEWHWLQL